MANAKPPPTFPGTPNYVSLPAGTVLYRIHDKNWPVDSFNPGPAHRYYGGGRFDGTDDDHYGYLYAGESVNNAIAETLLRDLDPSDTGPRIVPRPKIRGRKVSAIEIVHKLSLLSLRSGQDLSQFAQDPWLTTTASRDYAQTRHWGHRIRAHAPNAAGYVWLSAREPGTCSYVLFDDRIAAGGITPARSDPGLPAGQRADFDTAVGRRELAIRLSLYNATVSRR